MLGERGEQLGLRGTAVLVLVHQHVRKRDARAAITKGSDGTLQHVAKVYAPSGLLGMPVPAQYSGGDHGKGLQLVCELRGSHHITNLNLRGLGELQGRQQHR